MKFITECEVRMSTPMWNSTYDLQVLKKFGFSCRKVKTSRVQEVFFTLPEMNYLLLCCDGASKGNPGSAGFGFIGRNSNGDYLIAMAGGLGVATNYYAEVMAILCAGEWAIQHGFFQLIFRTYSQSVIEAFKSQKMPWFAISRWKICLSIRDWRFIHTYREVNFLADSLAKKGADLQRGENIIYIHRPAFLSPMENDQQTYYRFR
ncbi:uncharacterized protein LOC113315836 [Papaver somniferum]|uniref:uncharacterized protein LOC113315836 n=1 Tax=Papaver somniferum TaxID=3469 RepID=UPI000E6FAF92|nr:uncharacterized protein LOC113315836 [Papaver somniferum]